MSAAELSTTETGSERRRWERHAIQDKSIVTLMVDGQAYPCHVEDLSVGGIKLRFTGAPPPAERFELCHPVAGRFPALRAWERGDRLGVRFDILETTRQHVLRCLCLVLNPDGGEALAATA